MAPKRVRKTHAETEDDADDTAPKAHRALNIPEILLNILKHVRVFVGGGIEGPTNESRRHLFTAAQVCREFADIAQDLLWEYLPSFMPLAKLLPLCRVQRVYLLLEKLTPQSLARFNFRARQVHYIRAASHLPLDLTVILALNSAYHDQPLLPSLKGLSVAGDFPGMPVHLMFLSSSLRHLAMIMPLHPDKSTPALAGIFGTLSLAAARLKSLHLRSALPEGVLHARLSPFVHLQTVTLSGPELSANSNSPLLRHFLRLPSMQDLSIKSSGWSMEARSCGYGFDSLESLDLCALVQDLRPLLDALPSRSVAAMTVIATSTREKDWMPTWMSFSEAVVARLHVSLSDVCLTHAWQPHDKLADNLSSIRPWFGLQNLHSFKIDGRSLLDRCTDEDMLELARAVPRIKNLSLAFSDGSSDERATLKCLTSFALHCPLLEHLEIGLAENRPRTHTEPLTASPVLSHPLKKLTITNARRFNDTSVAVVEYLYRIFPLVVIDCVDISDLWHINEALQALRRVAEVQKAREAGNSAS